MLLKKFKNFFSNYILNSSPNYLDIKITPEQLINTFGKDLELIFPQFYKIPHRYKIDFTKRIITFLKHYEFIDKTEQILTLKDKILIAATYVKLTIGFKHYVINAIDKIIIYPTAQYFPELNETHIGHYNPKHKVIMLALDRFKQDIEINTGKDIALHEFTHALCFEMLAKNNKNPDSYYFATAYNKIKEWFEIPQNQEDIKSTYFLSPSAYTNQLEFVSSLVECFFKKEEKFKQLFPELYFYVGNMIKHPKTKVK
jgi:MtfA peptidase